MKTNCRAVRMPALAALLALLGGARAGVRGAGCYMWLPHVTPPKIRINAEYIWSGAYEKSYGEDIILHCSAKNATHLEMEENSESLQIIEVNTTTVQFRVKKPNLGRYSYSCVDGGTGCKVSLTVLVRPAMCVEVVGSLMVHRNVYVTHEFREYFVPLGEDYEVLCSGRDSEALVVTDAEGRKLQADVINNTFIKHRTQADRVAKEVYRCVGIGNVTTKGVIYFAEMITVIQDYYPECHNFYCFLYKSVLECSWNYSTDQIVFTLYYSDHTYGYEYTTLLCSDDSGKANGACTVNDKFKERNLFFMNHNISLLLTSCNEWICNNQSFAMNTDAIAKVNPVYNFAVLNISSRGVAVKWAGSSYFHYFKVEYQQTDLDDDWRQADMSTMRCDDYMRCVFILALPYPDTEYGVRVYARHKAATDDGLWSEPKSLRVTTKPRVERCACGAAPGAAAEPKFTISAETTWCDICALTEYTIKEGLALKKKIKSSLKEKLANINDYSRLLSKAKEIAKERKKYEEV